MFYKEEYEKFLARAKRRSLERQLDNARYDYWMGDLRTAIWRLMDVMDEVIKEIPEDENGERQPPTQKNEQKEKVEIPSEDGERDEDGWLIR